MEITEYFLSKIDNLKTDESEANRSADNALDVDYNVSARKHRNSLQRLSHLLEFVSYPGFLLIITAVFFLLFALARYTGTAFKSDLLQKISDDIGKALTYMGTVIITHVITCFLEQRKR